MNKVLKLLFAVLVVIGFSCNQPGSNENNDGDDKLSVITTTTMITDLAKQIGGDAINVQGLMGSGVDPHLYKASEGDVSKLYTANVIIYNGVHLEGKMDDILKKMNSATRKTYAIADVIPEQNLIKPNSEYSHHDPHIWFDIDNWKLAANYVAKILSENDSKNQELYAKNLAKYLLELDGLKSSVTAKIDKVPTEKRVLITAHDAFEYFGKAFNFEVVGLQGISTVSEAGAADVRNLAELITTRKIPAIFVESSVPKRNIEALEAAVKARGYQVEIGGELYSDALGTAGTIEGTYIGMYEYNVKTIVEALGKESRKNIPKLRDLISFFFEDARPKVGIGSGQSTVGSQQMGEGSKL